MKFRIEPKTFAAATAYTHRAIPARPGIPVLAGVVLDAFDGTVSLSSFDYETSARVVLDATVGEPGRVLVSGRLLADIAKALPAKPVDVAHDGRHVSIRCGSARFQLPTMHIEDYPQLPEIPEPIGTLPGDVFAQAVTQVAVAAGRDDTLPMLTGIRLEVAGGRLTLAATDRFRLAVRDLDWQPVDPGIELAALLPARPLLDTAKAVAAAPRVGIALAGGLVAVTTDRRQSTSRLLDAEFPRFRQLIPTQHSATADLPVEDLVAAVKRVSLVSDRVAQVACTFGLDVVSLTAGGDDGAGQAEEDLPCALEGESLTIGFNPAYLLDALASIPTPRVRFGLTNPTRPAVLRPLPDGDGLAPVGEFLALLMPLRLPS